MVDTLAALNGVPRPTIERRRRVGAAPFRMPASRFGRRVRRPVPAGSGSSAVCWTPPPWWSAASLRGRRNRSVRRRTAGRRTPIDQRRHSPPPTGAGRMSAAWRRGVRRGAPRTATYAPCTRQEFRSRLISMDNTWSDFKQHFKYSFLDQVDGYDRYGKHT